MKDQGLLFKSSMVKALLNTKPLCWPPEPIDPKLPYKGVTRRHVDLSTMHKAGKALWKKSSGKERLWLLNNDPERLLGVKCRFAAGTRIWVKETFYRCKDGYVCYAATATYCKDDSGKVWRTFGTDEQILQQVKSSKAWKVKPSILMGRAESRITLLVVSRLAERLHDITEEGAIIEGTTAYSKATSFIEVQPLDGMSDFKAGYRELWNKINGPDAWKKNPYVWVISFMREESE